MTFRTEDNRKLLLEFMEFVFPEYQNMDESDSRFFESRVWRVGIERLVDKFLKEKAIK